jgi:TPR repeat protein
VDSYLACQWFRRSAETGNEWSAYALGKLLLSMDRPDEAIRWLRRAATQGNQYAQYQMGKLYLADEIVPRDTVQAIRFFKDAAVQGNQYAQYALGKLYLSGRDVPRDVEEAAYWLQISADQGNQYAQFSLDRMKQSHDPSILLAVIRLLYYLGNTFRGRAMPATPIMAHIDRKRQEEIMEMRLASGHRLDDHEDPVDYNVPKMQ